MNTNFTINPEYHFAFVRTFTFRPDEEMRLPFETSERRNGRFIDATYESRVVGGRIRWQWTEEGQKWWGQISYSLKIINSASGEDYKSGWRTELMSKGGLRDEVPEWAQALLDQTHPHTVVQVVESAE